MSSSPTEAFNTRHIQLIEEVGSHDIRSEEFTEAAKNLEAFSKIRTLLPEAEPTPDPVPTGLWGRVKCGAASVWDNETTRVFIKAGGAFAGVAIVVWSTVHRDHVLEKQSMQQANQRPS